MTSKIRIMAILGLLACSLGCKPDPLSKGGIELAAVQICDREITGFKRIIDFDAQGNYWEVVTFEYTNPRGGIERDWRCLVYDPAEKCWGWDFKTEQMYRRRLAVAVEDEVRFGDEAQVLKKIQNWSWAKMLIDTYAGSKHRLEDR